MYASSINTANCNILDLKLCQKNSRTFNIIEMINATSP